MTPTLNYPELVWKKKIIDSVIIDHPYPVVKFGDLVVFVTQAGEFRQKLVAFNAYDGKRVWEWQDYYYHGTPKSLVFADRVYQYDNYLLFGSGGKQYCIDVSNGNTV